MSRLSPALPLIVVMALLGAIGGRADDASGPHGGSYVLTLGGQRFDPLAGVPQPPTDLAGGRGAGPDLQLVQLVGPTRAEWLDALRAEGLEIVQYIYPHTYVVWGGNGNVTDARANAAVRWSGPFLPAYRLLPRWRRLDESVQPFHAVLVRAADTEGIVRDIQTVGGRIRQRVILDRRFELVGFDLPGSRLADVARLPGVYTVQGIATDGGLRGEMSNQVNVNNVDSVNRAFPGYADWLGSVSLSGAGVIVADVDSGVQETHPDLVARMIACTGQTCANALASSHGTHTAGIIAADGSSGVTDVYGFLRGQGMAPGASLVEQAYHPWYLLTGGMRALMTDSYNNGASISSNSWGASGTPKGYDEKTMQVDIGVRDADPDVPGDQHLTYVLAIMNGHGGVSTQGTPDEAKNTITVGSTKMQRGGSGAQYLDIDNLSGNTAHGPALDGRNIPHIVAPGCYVDSCTVTSDHTLKCGTSMSAPHVAGSAALFVEYFRGLPNVVADPSPALIKAAFLVSARDLAGNRDADGQLLGHPFDSKQGWGRLDAEAVLDPQVDVRYWDNPVVFDNTGEEWTRTVMADDTDQPLRLMLVWTDAPGHGLGGATPAWNNNLDLIVETGNDTYYGNYFGGDGWSQVGGSPDYMNNTEGVFIGPTAAGEYTIRVRAGGINSDGVPSVGDDTDQDFALVCYNCALEPDYTVAVAPDSTDLCLPGQAVFTVELEQIGGFSEPVALSVDGAPAGTSAQFSPNQVTPPGDSVLTIDAGSGAGVGEHVLTIVGTAGSLLHTDEVTLRLFNNVPTAPLLDIPADGAPDLPLRPVFVWQPAAQASVYELQIAADADFADIVREASNLAEPAYSLSANLKPEAEYFWRVRARNACGAGAWSAARSFTTRFVPAILLVDDDDNYPDVRSYFSTALDTLEREYDVWDTENSDDEPDSDQLGPYSIVLWFTGAENGGACGPGPAGSDALADFLDHGKNLFISSQDYYYDRGVTAFMTEYLGVLSAGGDVAQITITGAGSVFTGFGPITLDYPFTNGSDIVNPMPEAETAFVGNIGDVALDKDHAVYRTTFWAFPFAAVPSAGERAGLLGTVLDWFRPWADCNENGVADHADIFHGVSLDRNANGVPDECEAVPGDLNCDGQVNFGDIDPFVLALADWELWKTRFPDCPEQNADVNGDGQYGGQAGFGDINPFVKLLAR